MEDMSMPPGFRFYPTEEELVSFYLHHKLEREREDLNRLMDRVIPIVDIYEFNPWDLPQFSTQLCHKDPEQWFFFIPRQEREARGGRPRRLTTTGYWKATGSPGFVYSSNNNRPVGFKRTMVFYNGRAPNGRKTEWKMNEYKVVVNVEATSPIASATPTLRHEFSLCRIYKKSKCLRSFDRRSVPIGRELQMPRELPPPAVVHYQGQATAGATVASHHQPSGSRQMAVAAERSMSSSESSSSGDHGNYPIISQTEETTNSSSSSSSVLLVDFDESFWCLDGFWEYSIN